jgi:hypothetical protein
MQNDGRDGVSGDSRVLFDADVWPLKRRNDANRFLEAAMTDWTAKSGRTSGTGVLADPAGQFARDYNRRTFLFEHGLGGHPLFELRNLVALSRHLPDDGASAYWSNGRVGVDDRWEKNQAARNTLQDTIANIADNDSLVIIKHINDDPEYGPVLCDFLDRVIELSGAQMEPDVVVKEALILISSPNRITPYHFDAECNYVVQVVGDKTFRVYDQADRTLLTELELEQFHAGDMSAAVYNPERVAEAVTYNLRAGQGVHVPTHAPHSAVVGDNVSVALSINYELRSVQRASNVYWMNSRLRALGITPKTPGQSKWSDGVKIAAARGARAARRLLQRTIPTPR